MARVTRLVALWGCCVASLCSARLSWLGLAVLGNYPSLIVQSVDRTFLVLMGVVCLWRHTQVFHVFGKLGFCLALKIRVWGSGFVSLFRV